MVKNVVSGDKKYLGGKEASKLIGVHPRTLLMWDKNNKIETMRTPGGKRLYNVQKYLLENARPEIKNDQIPDVGNVNIIYVRVPDKKYSYNLECQAEFLKSKYPDYHLIKDICSKEGLLKIINYAISGRLSEVVVIHNTIISECEFIVFEEILESYSNAKIVVKENEKLYSEISTGIYFHANKSIMRDISL